LDSPFSSLGSDKNKSFDYDTSYRSQHLVDDVPCYLPKPDYDTTAKVNPIYGQTQKMSTAARRKLDDTLY